MSEPNYTPALIKSLGTLLAEQVAAPLELPFARLWLLDRSGQPSGIDVIAGTRNDRALTEPELERHLAVASQTVTTRGIRLRDGEETIAFLEIDLTPERIAQAEAAIRELAAPIVTLCASNRLFASLESSANGKILVVDDDESVRSLLQTVLTRAGFEVILAEDGAAAIGIAIPEQPDLILIDWQMPVLDGVQATKRLKSLPETKSIPVVMLTSRSGAANRLIALEAGVADFIDKPFVGSDLVKRVQQQLRWRTLLSPDAAPAPPVLEAEIAPAVTPDDPREFVDREIGRAEALAERAAFEEAALTYKLAAEYATRYVNPDIGNMLYRLSGKMYLNLAESGGEPAAVQLAYAAAARMFLGAGNLKLAKQSYEIARTRKVS
jgi:DNA-binding response OmpR family regulator